MEKLIFFPVKIFLEPKIEVLVLVLTQISMWLTLIGVEQRSNYLTKIKEGKRIHTFLKSIISKVNIIARLEFELTLATTAFFHTIFMC